MVAAGTEYPEATLHQRANSEDIAFPDGGSMGDHTFDDALGSLAMKSFLSLTQNRARPMP